LVVIEVRRKGDARRKSSQFCQRCGKFDTDLWQNPCYSKMHSGEPLKWRSRSEF
jgi:hypothetical protein